MTPAIDELLVDAAPTKDFFISMLVRDIQLIPAVIDLVDNCIDGAIRHRADGSYAGLHVAITIGTDRFRIVDNCGGIPLSLARDYAFRFGRAEGMAQTPHSIGEFGVGMKRGLFKLGNYFEVRSDTTSDRFVLKVDVQQWRADPDWHFRFDSIDRQGVESDEAGTMIEVRELHPSVSRDFERQQFLNDLTERIAAVHQDSMDRGLVLSVNGVPINIDPAQLLESDELKAACEEIVLDGTSPVDIKLYTGLGTSSPTAAGWYVFCNGRAVLEADQTIVTGWGADEGETIPRMHNQFARFRGYAFFTCDDAGRLPWTTTKTGVDANSDVFRQARSRMVKLMRPVIDFLNQLDREKDAPPADMELLEDMVNAAQPKRIGELATISRFTAPPRPKVRLPDTQSIQFRVEKERADKAKKVLKVSTLGEVGRRTFDYFYKLECEET